MMKRVFIAFFPIGKMDDKTLGIIILVLSLLALGFVYYVNVNDSFDFIADPLYGDGFGALCSSQEDCSKFCLNSMGECISYCESNSINELCKTLSIGGSNG